jgi:Tol biopolymer transport system component
MVHAGCGGGTSELSEFGQVFVIQRDGSELRQVDHGQGAGAQVWSPDGRLLAFVSGIASGPGYPIEVSAVEGDYHRVTPTQGIPTFLSWSKDGKRVRFLLRPGQRGGLTGWWLGSVDLESSELRKHPLGFTVHDGDWSPDGRYFAFAARPQASRKHPKGSTRGGVRPESSVWIVDPAGSGARPVATISGEVLRVAFSPDGRRIAFVGSTGGRESVWVTGLGASRPRLISPDLKRPVYPAWSPDGRRLAVAAYGAGGGYHVYVVSAVGGPLSQVSGDVGVGEPAWSPDGQWIAATAGADADASIKLFRPSGADEHTLVEFPNAVTDTPVWSPGGSQLSFVARRRAENQD